MGTTNRRTLDKNAVTFKLLGKVVAEDGNSSVEEALPPGLDYHNTLSEETIAIACILLHTVLSDQAGPAVLFCHARSSIGGVMRPVHLHLFCQSLFKQENCPPPSFTTFSSHACISRQPFEKQCLCLHSILTCWKTLGLVTVSFS